MWARVCEFMLGCWMAMSPFIFSHAADELGLWVIDFSAATTAMVLSLLSFWRPARLAHLMILVVAVVLIGYGRFVEAPPLSPAAQNQILVGLLLLMFAIVPNWASTPPKSWQEGNIPTTLTR